MERARGLAVATLVAGLVVLAISQVFVALHLKPAHPLGGAYGNEAILAFELARTPGDVERVIGANPPDTEAAAVRAQMDHANRVDFAYMACYATFLALSCMLVAAVRRRSFILIGVLLGPLAALFDRSENLALLQLTRPDADVVALLPQLQLYTMLKWELLAILAALFAGAFVARERVLQSAIAITVALVVLGSGIATLVDPAKAGAWLLWSIAAVWIWQIAYAGRCVRL